MKREEVIWGFSEELPRKEESSKTLLRTDFDSVCESVPGKLNQHLFAYFMDFPLSITCMFYLQFCWWHSPFEE